MGKADKVLKMVNEIILGLPDTSVQTSWGKPHFKVGKKLFAGCDEQDGRPNIQFGLEPEHMDLLLQSDARFEKSKYAGAIQIYADLVKDRRELESLLRESYRLKATNKILAKLAAVPTKTAKKKTAKKKTAKKKRAAR